MNGITGFICATVTGGMDDMGVPVIAFGRKEDVDYITLGPTKEQYEKAVRPLVCKNCGAPLTRGLNKCEYCGTVYANFKIQEENNVQDR